MLGDKSHRPSCRAGRLNYTHEQVLSLLPLVGWFILLHLPLLVGVTWSRAVIQRNDALPSGGQQVSLPTSGT